MAIKAFIFDYANVLTKLGKTTGRSKWISRLGLDCEKLTMMVLNPVLLPDYFIGKLTQVDLWSGISNYGNLTMEELELLKADFWSDEVVNSSLLDYIATLRKTYKTAVLSNAGIESREVMEGYYRFQNYFDHLIISAEVMVAKPDPIIFQIALDRVKVLPEEAVFVDDLQENIDSARSLGITAILYESTSQVIAKINSLIGAQ